MNNSPQRPPRAPRRFPLWKTALFSLAPVVVLLLVAEIVARVVALGRAEDIEALERGRRPPPNGEFALIDMIRTCDDPERVFEQIPNVTGSYLGYPYKTNSFGMRDAETTLHKPPGVFRVAAVGDSYMWGWLIPAEATYPSLLEDFLNETIESFDAADRAGVSRYEVLNFSVPGYNTVMEAAAFESDFSRFDPDVALLGFCFNDLQLPNFLRRRPSVWSPRRSFLFDLLSRWRRRLPPAPRGLMPWSDGARGEMVQAFDPDPRLADPEFRPLVGFDNYRRALGRFADWSNRTGRPVVQVYTRDTIIDPPKWSRPHPARTEAENNARVQAAAREAGLTVVTARDEQEAFLKRHPEATVRAFWVAWTDTHPSRVGQICLLKAVYRDLVENRRLPDWRARAERLEADLARWDAEADRAYEEFGEPRQ